MRGNLCRPSSPLAGMGSIPACAGEPILETTSPTLAGVYPRVCGGTPKTGKWLILLMGLSPRVRGNRIVVVPKVTQQGSIPACAGEPPDAPVDYSEDRVYPRVCGGTGSSAQPETGCAGLSPRVRGNRVGAGGLGTEEGSIPACAGEPSLSLGRLLVVAVYPRVCGGTASNPRPRPLRQGLSPRVRGNLCLLC